MKLSLSQLFFIFLKLGCFCFGGPIAHLSFFHVEFVERRKWVDEKTYMSLVALCQSLPGPASSQVAAALGMKEHGVLGGMLALLGFLLPSVLILILSAYSIDFLAKNFDLHWLDGLKLAVVAIVAQAILSMSRRFCYDKKRIMILILATLITLFSSSLWAQLVTIVLGAVIGKFWLRDIENQTKTMTPFVTTKTAQSLFAWSLLLIGFFILPIINHFFAFSFLQFFDIFFRTGALVFGGGHVILPLLQTQLVNPGWINSDIFLVGYGFTQALPGPLFSFAAFLGTIIGGWSLGIICLLAIYLPSVLILLGVLPVWEKWRHRKEFQAVLAGINAAVVGLLLSAFYTTVWLDTMHSLLDVFLVLIALALLEFFKISQWIIVLLMAITGCFL